MLAILKPVFESIWKRKETKIFIGISILNPLFVLISTFLPKENNFFNPHTVDGGELFTATSFVGGVFGIANTTFLPILALFYLTYTVFRGEADARTLFLYKDIKRKDIFWAKIVSLIEIVLIYSATYILLGLIFYYSRIGHMDYASLNFWSQELEYNVEFFQLLLSENLTLIICIFLASFMSLKKSLGATMVTSFIYLLALAILNRTDFIYLTPTGQRSFDLDNSLYYPVAFVLPALVTLVYSSGLAHFTLKHFKGMEY